MLQSQQPHLFGANDHPKCLDCGGRMNLIRRTPDREFGTSYERQIFVCFDCRHQIERNADAGGQPHA